MKRMKDNTIAQFFADTGFEPPKGKRGFGANFGFETGVDEDMEYDGYDGIPDTIADITKDLNDSSEHPAPGIIGDYYMFNDPGTRTEPDGGRTPLSPTANQLNQNYHKKDLSRIESASDVHLESLEQPVSEFPRHDQIHSQMEPSVIGPIDQSGVQPPQPGQIVLEQPAILEGIEYPAGTIILIESMRMSEEDAMFEDPHAKLCPLCQEPYVGDACSCVKNAQPGKGAIRVDEGVEVTGLGDAELEPYQGGWQIPGEYVSILRDLEKRGAAGSALARGLSDQARIPLGRAMGLVKQFLNMNGYYTQDIDRHSVYKEKVETSRDRATVRSYIAKKIKDGHSEKTVVSMASKIFDLSDEDLHKIYKKVESALRFRAHLDERTSFAYCPNCGSTLSPQAKAASYCDACDSKIEDFMEKKEKR